MFGFDPFEFVHQFVVLGITDDRRIQDVVTMIVEVDLGFEFFVS
jgi:hypothetical protein